MAGKRGREVLSAEDYGDRFNKELRSMQKRGGIAGSLTDFTEKVGGVSFNKLRGQDADAKFDWAQRVGDHNKVRWDGGSFFSRFRPENLSERTFRLEQEEQSQRSESRSKRRAAILRRFGSNYGFLSSGLSL